VQEDAVMHVSSDALLTLPLERAWATLLRWEDQARWMKDADTVKVLGDRREGVGTTIAVRTRVLNVPVFTERLEDTVWEPPRLLVMAHRSFVRGTGTWRFDPEPSGSRFTWTEDLSLPIPALGELALLAYRPFMRRLMRGALANLQAFAAAST
jgi:hypothetical protein